MGGGAPRENINMSGGGGLKSGVGSSDGEVTVLVLTYLSFINRLFQIRDG